MTKEGQKKRHGPVETKQASPNPKSTKTKKQEKEPTTHKPDSLLQKFISKIYDPSHKWQSDLWPLKWLALAFIIIDFHGLNHHPFLKIDIITISEFLYFLYALLSTIFFRTKLSSKAQILNLTADFLIFTFFLALSLTIFPSSSRLYILYLIPIIYCGYWFHWVFTLIFTTLTSVAYVLLFSTLLDKSVVAVFGFVALAAILLKYIGPKYFEYFELQKRAEKLEQEREYTRSLMKGSIDGYVEIDESGYITDANKLAWELLGYTEKEIFKQNVTNIYAPGEATKIMNLLRQSPDGTIENIKTVMISKDKEKIPILLSASFLYDRNLNLLKELAKGEKFPSIAYFRDIRAEEIFYSIATDITFITKEKELLDKIVSIVARTLKAENCGVFFYNEVSNRLEIISTYGMPEALVNKDNKKREHYKEREGITGTIFSLNETLNISNINVRKRQPMDIDIKWRYAERFARHSRFGDFKHFLGTPLSIHGAICGVIRVFNKYRSSKELDPRGFTEKDQLLLERISNQVSILLEKVQNKERFEAISNVGREINEKFDLSLDELLQIIAEQVVTGMKFKACYLRLIEDGNRLKIKACYGIGHMYIGDEKYTSKIGEGISGKVAKTGKMRIVIDLHNEKEFKYKDLLEKENLASLLSIPLKYRGRVIGVINCYTRREHEFTDQEIQIMETFADYAAVAIQNKRRVDELMALSGIGRELLKPYQPETVKPFETEKLLDLILQQAKAISGADYLCIKRYDERFGKISTISALNCKWYEKNINFTFKLNDGKIGKGIKSGETTIIKNFELEKDTVKDVPSKGLLNNIKSRIIVPFKIYGRVFGALCLESYRENFFTEDDSLILKTFSIHAGIAIRNANFFSKLRAITETFSTISELHTDMDDVLKKIAQKAAEALEADLLVLYRYDKKNRQIIWPPTYAGEIYYPEYMTTQVRSFQAPLVIINKGETHYSIKAGEDPLMAPPKQKEEREAPERFVIREKIVSSAGIVLKVSQEIVGVMFINYRTPHEFNADERQIIEIFASYIAIAIQNVRHFKEKKTADIMQTLGRIAANFAHNIKNDLGTISLYTGDLMDETDLKSSQYYPLSQIKEGISKIASDINFFLNASKLSVQRKSLSNVKKLVNELKSEISADLETRNVKFNIEMPPNLPEIEIDPVQIKMALINLAQNSFDAMPEGGKITLSISKSDKSLSLEWADSGCGISPENAYKIFDVLWTSKYKGYGLGLFYTKAIIEEHGGSISLDQDFKKGARFVIMLPLKEFSWQNKENNDAAI
jgi:PAS domain S-box-containing protein